MFPLGTAAGCRHMAFCCGRLGAVVPGTFGSIGNGSSKMAVGWPLPTAAMKLSICSGPSDDGCTASSTSYFSVIGCVGIDLHHVVLLLQLVDDRLARAWGDIVCRSKPPKSWASVVSTPNRLALLLADGADRADQLVFDRDAAVDERHHDLVQARR